MMINYKLIFSLFLIGEVFAAKKIEGKRQARKLELKYTSALVDALAEEFNKMSSILSNNPENKNQENPLPDDNSSNSTPPKFSTDRLKLKPKLDEPEAQREVRIKVI